MERNKAQMKGEKCAASFLCILLQGFIFVVLVSATMR